ncbi:MAG TPA: Do family serine endopeptidase, partial [Brevundimonas sp.]|nr:Do family serine endopeptidase [Brevundimonas sp.]
PQGAPLSFADIFAQVAPAVVQIDVKTRVRQPNMIQIPGLPFAIPNPNGGQQPGQEGEGEDDGATAMGAGSGFFIAANGFIVTNNHVVADATEITVKLADGRELEATVVGTDPATDLAVIKVEGRDFPFVSFEDRAQPRVGDWVIAVGNPFGLGGTATAGIVSALSRQNLDDETAQYVDFLQIDAAINRGNSGGPTFDIYGRVIGVNSAIYSQTGGSVGIGFAIPANIAKSITDQLMERGRVERGYVGLTLWTPSPDAWEALGQPRDFKGAIVQSVNPGGPAEQGGVRVDDIIVEVNGQAVASSTEASRRVGEARPGEAIRLEIIRGGRRQTLNVRATVRPPEAELNAQEGSGEGRTTPVQPPAAQGEPVEGISVTPLTAALRSRYSIPETVNGVIITEVARSTPAARLGLQAGFVITRVNTQAVTSAAEFRAAVAAAKQAGRPSILLYVRTPQGNVVPVPMRFDDGE